jgi:predicted RNA-binding Zn-ribbon protein involved in translation (DUF1610 family)
MGVFDSKEEKERKKKAKEEEKERKRKEFERIMASNPEVTINTHTKTNAKLEKEKEKLKRKAEMERLRNAGRTVPPSKQVSHQSNNNSNVARCPKCGSTSITANKKGFSLAKGALGVATVGAYGVLAAGHGKNKVLVTCLNCGKQWKPGK